MPNGKLLLAGISIIYDHFSASLEVLHGIVIADLLGTQIGECSLPIVLVQNSLSVLGSVFWSLYV